MHRVYEKWEYANELHVYGYFSPISSYIMEDFIYSRLKSK